MVSEARLVANRLNAQHSTGPNTVEGKAESRRNALKHGLTGAGVVIPRDDAAAVAARVAEFQADLTPDGSVATRLLAERAAILSVRLDRSVRHDFAVTADRLEEAEADFHAVRQDEADRLFDAVASDSSQRAPLLAMPEGIELVLRNLDRLRARVEQSAPEAWTESNRRDLIRCVGRDAVLAIPATEADQPGEILRLIVAEIRRLEAQRATFDHAPIERALTRALDRAYVGDDPATLRARRYELATERAYLRTVQEIRTMQQPAPSSTLAPRADADAEAAALARSIAATRAQIHRLEAAPAPVPIPAAVVPTRMPQPEPAAAPDRVSAPVPSLQRLITLGSFLLGPSVGTELTDCSQIAIGKTPEPTRSRRTNGRHRPRIKV